MNFSKEELARMYLNEKKSCSEIASYYGCSESAVNYWLKKLSIKKRNLSDAIYLKHNPQGDPFVIKDNKIDVFSFILVSE